MKSLFQRSGPIIVLIALAALVPIVSSPLAHAERNTVTTTPSLHNPNFDNGVWYEFSHRYDVNYPSGVWVPAGADLYDTIQDWRVWFLDGTDIVDCDPYTSNAHSGDEAVKIRSFPWSPIDHQVAGLYQVIENVTPCRYYQFQMYGLSRQGDTDDSLVALQVGIEPTGWHPDSDNDPAVHGAWPAGTVMGDSHAYLDPNYGPLVVTAEALSDEIVVFTYADAIGGNSHKIQWDTGSFTAVPSQDLVSDPANAPVNAGGINSGPTAAAGYDGALVSWHTNVDTVGQVYYHQGSDSSLPLPSTEALTHTIYIPVFNRTSSEWHWTAVDENVSTSHSLGITGLQPNTTYSFFVAARGVSGDTCVTWTSAEGTFTTN